MPKLELAGQRFGRLVVIRDTGERRRGNVVWHCKCDCGAKVLVVAVSLRFGSPKSCGCLQSEEQRDRARKRPFESLWNSIVPRFGRKLSYKQFLKFTEIAECHYCGEHIDWKPYDTRKRYQLDRVDNRKGYTAKNCVVCCWPCNRMKRETSYEEFIARIKKIAARRP